MKLILKKFYQNFKEYNQNKNFNNDAFFYLKNLENINGKLDRSLIKICDEYAIDIFKSKVYAPWLYVYTAMHKEFKEGWIPDNYFGLKILPKINGNYGKIASLRPLNKKVFDNSEFFSDLVYIANSKFYRSDNLEPLEISSVKKYLFKENPEIVFKENDTGKGNGIFFFTEKNFNPEEVLNSIKNGVFQPKITQHEFFSKFNNSAVASIRITTFLNNGVCEVKFADIRLPNGNTTHIKVGHHIRIPLDIENGKFNEAGYLSNWEKIFSHPGTNEVYTNQIIPKFHDMLVLVKSLHIKFPLVQMIGWDLIVDNNNKIQILEWNGSHPGIKFAESTIGPIFSKSDLNL